MKDNVMFSITIIIVMCFGWLCQHDANKRADFYRKELNRRDSVEVLRNKIMQEDTAYADTFMRLYNEQVDK